jgi:hypothetical protein
MKKIVLIALFGAASVVAYGQGQINFSNYYGSQQPTGITYGNGPNAGLGVGSEISVELFYGVSTDTLTSQLTGVSSSLIAVGWNGVSTPTALPPVGPFAGAGVFNGTPVTLGAYGTTYALAIYASGTVGGNLYSGWSAIFTGANQASSSVGAPDLPTGLLNGSFTVVSTPEPSSLALAGLGGFGMLMAFRRKKA